MPIEDRLLPALIVAIAAAIGWDAVRTHPAVHERPPDAAEPREAGSFDTRISEVSEAIALAEGYYAPGEHDGHSLPFALNNPGALKKPARGTGALPTWKDTGLVVFPNSVEGWSALRFQVRLMLTGASGIYDPSDTLRAVGEKYADGSDAWGRSVAAQLGVPPDASLSDVAGDVGR